MVNGLQKIKSVVVKGEAGAADLPRVTSNGGLALAQALAQLEGPAARPVAAPPPLCQSPRQRRLLRHRGFGGLGGGLTDWGRKRQPMGFHCTDGEGRVYRNRCETPPEPVAE